MPASRAVTPTGRRSIGVDETKLRDIAKKRYTIVLTQIGFSYAALVHNITSTASPEPLLYYI